MPVALILLTAAIASCPLAALLIGYLAEGPNGLAGALRSMGP